MRSQACSILDAPSDLGLRRTGVDGLPDALRAAGLLEGLPDARYAGRLHVPPYIPLRDEVTNVLNPSLAAFYLVVVPQFVPRDAPFAWSVMTLMLVHISMAFPWRFF